MKAEPFTKFLALAIGLCYLGKQEEAETIQVTLDAISNPTFRDMAKTLLDVCAYAATGNVLKIQQLLHICSDKPADVKEDEAAKEPAAAATAATPASGTTSSPAAAPAASTSSSSSSEKKEEKSSKSKDKKKDTSDSGDGANNAVQQAIATIGIALIGMAEDIGSEMAFRAFGHLLRFGELPIKRAVPLALGLISVSNPRLNILETLSKFSHDSDPEVCCNAIFAMGLVGAGTNNARLATMLRQLAQFHAKEPNALFMTRIAQGLTHLGKGTLTLSPFHSDRQLLVPTALAGLLAVIFSMLDVKQTILGKSHFLLYFLAPAIQPRMLVTFNEELQPLPVSVRVGQAVDVVGQAGKPKTITGFQTHTTPVLLALGERAELATEEYLPLTPVLEGFVILRKNPNYVA
jgi:26S proteasome regulatory subunit N1